MAKQYLAGVKFKNYFAELWFNCALYHSAFWIFHSYSEKVLNGRIWIQQYSQVLY